MMKVKHDLTHVFVAGPGRSGTTLLQHLLASSPHTVGLPETGLAAWTLDGPERRVESWRGVLHDVPRGKRLTDLAGADLGHSLDGSLPGMTRLESYHEITACYALLKSGADTLAHFIVDKDPLLSLQLTKLRSGFPESLIYSIIRDPRDTLASRKKAPWSAEQPLARSLFALHLQATRTMEADASGTSSGMVRYEDLVSSPGPALQKLAPNMVSDGWTPPQGRAMKSDLVFEDESSWKGRVTQEITSSSIGSWRQSLSPLETSFVESACAKLMDEGRYERSCETSRRGQALGVAMRLGTRLAARAW